MANPRTKARVIKFLERETGFEPATSTLARSHSTTELLPLDCSILDKAPTSVKPPKLLNYGFSAYLPRCPGPLGVQLRSDHLAVAEMQNAIPESRRLGVMRDHQHGLAQLLIGTS
jgi:hypothetical protein